MALPFFNAPSKKFDQIIAVDLGGRSTKAIILSRKGSSFALQRYCLLDAPIYETTLAPDVLAAHLKSVVQALEAKTKLVTIALGAADALVRQAELPAIPVPDLRLVLKNNSKNYLQQDLHGHVFDCHYVVGDAATAKNAQIQKQKVLVGGARQQLIADLQTALRHAGLHAHSVIPGVIAPMNAFEFSQPDAFAKDAIALVNIGFKTSSICLSHAGELTVTRVVNIGGDRLTQGLADSMGITYLEAEGIKVGMASEVQSNLEPLITPLGRELRACIDFFEHQQDRTVGQVYICGGTARSELILKSLQAELLAPCHTWNPAAHLEMELPPAQAAELEQIAPQLTVAMGAAAAALN